MPTPRVSRGRASQEMVAAWFRAHGAPEAKSRAASLPGTDVYDVPGMAIEVKARADESITTWLKQAVKNCPFASIPFVVYRPNGYGPERVAEWPVVLRLEDMTELLQHAGFLQEEAA